MAYMSSYGGMAEPTYLLSADENYTGYVGYGEDDESACQCGCPASETVAWVSSLIEGLQVDDQRKVMKMLLRQFDHVISDTPRSVTKHGNCESIFTGADERTIELNLDADDTSATDDVCGAAERHHKEPHDDTHHHTDDVEEVEFSFDKNQFDKVTIQKLPTAKDDYLNENEYEQIEMNFNTVDEQVEDFDFRPEFEEQLFEIFH